MKILIHTTKSPYTRNSIGGAETSLRLIAEEFAQNGHQVTYLSPSNKRFLHKRNEPIKGVEVVDYLYMKQVKIFNQGLVPGFILKFMNSLFLPLVLKKVGIASYDIVHTFYELHFLEDMIDIKEKYGYKYKIVMRMAGLYWWHDISTNNSSKKSYEWVFNEVDVINYISEGLKDMTEKLVKEVNLIYNPKYTFTGDIGVKINENLPRWEKEQKEGETFNIIVATRFSKLQKRQDILVKALNSLKKEINFKVIMIGEGGNKRYIQSLIDKYGLQDVIEIISFMSQYDLWNNLLKADLLCHPTENEGLGKIIIESMAMGLPVLTSDISPLNTYIKDGFNGFLVKNEVVEWEKKLKLIIGERKNLDKISQNEVEFAHNKYDSRKNIKMYEKEFLRLIDL